MTVEWEQVVTEAATSIDLIPIKSQTRTIQTCFQQCLYDVPNFQRPYSWTLDQLEDFWNDVVLAQGDFFFGSTVTWVSEQRDLFNDTYSIIDGQQRLTTSTIALSVIRDVFYSIARRAGEASDLRSAAQSQGTATQKYLIVTDDDGNSYPVLRRPEPMFYERIQNPDAIPSGAKWNTSAELLGAARKFFEAQILAVLEGQTLDSQLEHLKGMRANVLKARVIQVELASEEDGFLIFETLNTRGADLRLSHLVKNLLIRGGAKNGPDRQAIADRWDRLVERVQDGRTNPDVADRFIWQSWNSRRTAVTEAELFKAISRRVGQDSEAHISHLSELEVDSQTYEWLEYEDIPVQSKVRTVRNAFAIPEFVDSVRALAIMNVSVANSTVLSVVRKYEESSFVTEAQLIGLMRLVENFHFQFTALTNSGSTGGTRGRYNRFAVRFEEAKTKSEATEAINDLRDKLRASLPARERAEKAFRELFYAPAIRLNQMQKLRSRKIFIIYVLMAFAKADKLMPPGQNLASWSIEHIKPQALGGGDFRDPVYSIGNLTLLTRGLNSSLGDAPLPRKLEILRNGNAFFDSELVKWADSELAVPSDAQISERASALAMDALDRVWSL
jgi:hypothetical protein